jgi:methylmalonyl-CoA mutase N-terminal domain/subunit
VAEAVYGDIEFFANYGFNKAHAADYAMITCQTAYLNGANVMPPLVEAVKAYATVGEISDVMREVFATYEEPAVF